MTSSATKLLHVCARHDHNTTCNSKVRRERIEKMWKIMKKKTEMRMRVKNKQQTLCTYTLLVCLMYVACVFVCSTGVTKRKEESA